MDIREHWISSFFFHVIAILLVAAVSQYQLRGPAGLTVSLSADSFGNSPKVTQAKVEGTQEMANPAPSAVEEAADETAESPSEEKVVAEEKAAQVTQSEKVPETPQAAATGMPGAGQDGTWLARFHHVIFMNTSAFVENTSQSIQKALRKEIENDPSGGLSEGTAEVTFYFNEEGGFGEIWGATNSEKLESVLNRLDWRSIPSPGDYRLRMRGLHVKIKIDRGEPTLSFTAL